MIRMNESERVLFEVYYKEYLGQPGMDESLSKRFASVDILLARQKVKSKEKPKTV